MRYAVFAHRDLDLHARVVDFAKHLLHPAHRLAVQGRRLHKFNHHDLARLGGSRRAPGYQNVLAVAFVFGCDEPYPPLLQQTPDDRLLRAFDDFKDATLGPPLAVAAHHAHLDPVLVQDSAHFIGGQVDVWRAVVARNESVSITVTLHRSLDFVQQAAGGRIILDTIAFFPEMPRWRNW